MANRVRNVPNIGANYGLIYKLAYRTWLGLPQGHRQWVELEDVVQEGILHYCRIASKYERNRNAKESTYLYFTLENFYRSYLQRFLVGMRNGDTIPMDALEAFHPLLAFSEVHPDYAESEKRVCRALSLMSPALLRYLRDNVFACPRLAKRGARGRYPCEELVIEMRRICRITSATMEDFLRISQLASIH